MKTAFYFVLCFVCTTLGAISGIGGGVIIKPAMDAISGMDAFTISFLSGLTVESMAVVSITQHYMRAEPIQLEPRRGTWLAVGGAAGGILGKNIFSWFKAAVDRKPAILAGQNIILFLLTALVFLYYRRKDSIQQKNLQSSGLCLLAGLALGLLSSFLGIGGGPINLMVLSFFFHMDTKTAALHSLYIILFSQTASLITTIISASVPQFSIPALGAMVSGGIIGAFAGRGLNRRFSAQQVDRLFMGMLVVILSVCIYNILRFAV